MPPRNTVSRASTSRGFSPGSVTSSVTARNIPRKRPNPHSTSVSDIGRSRVQKQTLIPKSSPRVPTVPRPWATPQNANDPEIHSTGVSHQLDPENEIIMAMHMRNDGSVGCAFISFDSAVLEIMEDIPLGDIEYVERILVHIEPTMILVPLRVQENLEKKLVEYCDRMNTGLPDEKVVLRHQNSGEFSYDAALRFLCGLHSKFSREEDTRLITTTSGDCSSVQMMRLASAVNLDCRISIECSAALITDLRRRQEIMANPRVLEPQYISMFTLKDFMFINVDSLTALQIVHSEMHPSSLSWGAQDASSGSKESLSVYGLFHSLAASPMGKLKLRQLFLRPLLEIDIITHRHQTIAFLTRPENQDTLNQLTKALRKIKNIHKTLDQLRKEAAHQLSTRGSIQVLDRIISGVDAPALNAVGQLISKTINLEGSKSVSRAVVATGINPKLHELRRTYDGMEDLLNTAAAQMIQITPLWARDYISNCIFYPQLSFLTVVQLDLETKIAKYSGEGTTEGSWQEMFVAEGSIFYKNEAMRELDEQFGDMYSVISDMEIEILHGLSLQIIEYEDFLSKATDVCAELDCMVALAIGAQKYNWVQPTMTTDNIFQIKGGRHPLQELVVPSYIPNGSQLAGGIGDDDDFGSLISAPGLNKLPTTLVLTGPNHSGKSVYLKQTALVVYLAHIGSFVPAEAAVIGITDKILTRISTRESSGQHQSAFSIDLRQIAFAAKMATRRSLVLVDEFGKGTRSDDGAALLAALIDHFVGREQESPKLMVATHLHEIIHGRYLEGCSRVALAHMDVQRVDKHIDGSNEGVVYLYRLRGGSSMSSFGSLCASLNGVDDAIVQRAEVLMEIMARNEDLRVICSEMTDEEQRKYEAVEEIARGFVQLSLDDPEIVKYSVKDVIGELIKDTTSSVYAKSTMDAMSN